MYHSHISIVVIKVLVGYVIYVNYFLTVSKTHKYRQFLELFKVFAGCFFLQNIIVLLFDSYYFEFRLNVSSVQIFSVLRQII